MSSILKGLTNEGENVAVIYIDGKPIAKYTKKHEAEDDAQRIRKKFPNKNIEVKQEVREAEGDTLHDPEYSLPEARRITKAIKYDDTAGEIITQIQMLAERTEGIDSKTLEYSIDEVLSAKNSLESAVYGLEEAFEDAARNAQYKRDEVDEGNYNDNRTGFRRGPRDDERHDLDVQKPSREEWGLKINGKVWSKDGKDVTFASKEQALKARQTLLAKRPELEIGLVTRKVSETLDENLKQWFKEKWVRFGPDGKIRGDCARGDDSEGKPKCLPQSKAHNLGKEGRASAASRKRREDPNPERSGKAINVNTKKKTDESELDEACWDGYKQVGGKMKGGKMVPNCVPKESVEQVEKCPHCGGELVSEELMHEKQDACYRKVKSRYKVWPSAYASGALVQCRKKGASNWGNGGKKNENSVMKGIVDEAGSPAQQAAIAIAMKKDGKKPKSLGESDSSDAVYNAVLNRIMRRHLDLLQEYGPKIVMYAIEDVANGVGDLEEIGSSDVSIWTKQVISDLQSGQYAHLKETPADPSVEGQPSGRRIYRPKPAGTFAEDTAYAGGMGQGGNAGQSYRKFKPKSAGTFKESAIMAGLKRESK